jgi:hypothetical protein
VKDYGCVCSPFATTVIDLLARWQDDRQPPFVEVTQRAAQQPRTGLARRWRHYRLAYLGNVFAVQVHG